jgi:type II secretion system protein C
MTMIEPYSVVSLAGSHRYLPRLVALVATIMLAWQVGHLPQRLKDVDLDFLLETSGSVAGSPGWPEPGKIGTTARVASSPDRGRVFQDLTQLAERPLFGVPVMTPAPPETLPVTALNLRLVGTLAQAAPQQARALIQIGTAYEKTFREGDRLPVIAEGGTLVTLHSIHPDHVILARGQRFERLSLPQAENRLAALVSRVDSAGPRPGSELAFGDWRFSPEQILGSVHARPIQENGLVQGIEIRPLRNARAFNRAGFRPGDVVVSVEGMPVGAIASTDQLLADLVHRSSVSVMVQRNGQTIPVQFQLTN